MDDPAEPFSAKPVPLNDVLDMRRAPADSGEAQAAPTPWQADLPRGGRGIEEAIGSDDAPRPYTAPIGGGVTAEGGKVPPAPPSLSEPQDLTPNTEGQNLIDLFRPLLEGDQ
ncbi:MAG TPA: hypothetical protein VM915_09675, partial [Verrucomicrobiae bacterium]|jgi:hypothetical protein|nr:hypothetical protein [Verrucomicrobiae bacterium]